MIHNNNYAVRKFKVGGKKLIKKLGGICHWCGVGVVRTKLEDNGIQPPNARTRDHIYPKGHPIREAGGEESRRTVTACYSCNQRRNDEFQNNG